MAIGMNITQQTQRDIEAAAKPIICLSKTDKIYEPI